MSLTQKATHWFVTCVPREQIVYALEALAATGQVELEQDIVNVPLPDSRELRESIEAGEQLIARYADLLPAPDTANRVVTGRPEKVAQDALATLRHWLARQLRRRRATVATGNRLHNLELLREAVDGIGDTSSALADFSQHSSFLTKRLYACPNTAEDAPAEGNAGIVETYQGPAHRFHIVLCLPEKGEAFDYLFRMRRCEIVDVPDWLGRHWPERNERLPGEIRRLTAQMVDDEAAFQADRGDPALLNALREFAVLRWYLDHTVMLTQDGQRCHVAGWTSASSPAVLDDALHRADVDAVTLFRPGPPNRPPPIATSRNLLTSPFRVFVDMMGTPGSMELDPTPLLSVIVPVLFGLMFPDLGHGLVLAALSLVMAPRHPRLRFLLPCGLAAAGFGALFGETFGTPALPPLWFSPLEHPLFTLFAPLAIGVLIILLGLVLSGVEARLRGTLRQWWWRDAAVLVLYLSVLAALFQPLAIACAGLALLWYLAGSVANCTGNPWRCLGSDVGRLSHSALELGLNTLSFIRLGAFALAHAALSHTLVDITGMIDSPALQLIALTVGHGLIIVLEGLVVFVQTTRLVLFEFFIRFLRADGRLLRPLQAPARRAR